MTHRADVARGHDVVARWCALAEQRLQYLTELFETGRWRRYHSELAFLENIREAKTAVEIWRDLSMREGSRDNSAVDISWLGRNRISSPRGQTMRDQIERPQPAVIVAEPLPPDASMVGDSDHVSSDDAPSAPVADASVLYHSAGLALENAPEQTLDIASIEQRYPLLRNAL
jgi:uncharacterized repeat protein (TIGR03809 family)